MKLLPSQTDVASLSAFGEEARALLMERNYSGLADRFGYALAYGRTPSEAIEADFLRAAASPYKTVPGDQPISIKYFGPNKIGGTGLFAVVECNVPVADGAVVFLDLVVRAGREKLDTAISDKAALK